jgi:hypothetical protein
VRGRRSARQVDLEVNPDHRTKEKQLTSVRRRSAVVVLAVTAALAGLVQAAPAGARPAPPAGSTPGGRPAAGAVANPDSTLGKGWRTAADRAVTSAADSDGVHVLVADSKDAYAWRTAAVLAEPGMPADTWIGNSCVIDPGHAAVAYAPRTFTNHQDMMLGGAFTAVVNLDSGAVTKLPFTASLAYFDPTCNPATHTAAFTAYRDDKTRLVTVDTSGRTVADTTAGGQVTSAVPVADGTVAALGNRLVHIARSGKAATLATTGSVPYDIRPTGRDRTTGKDSYAFLDRKGETTARAEVWNGRRTTTVATAALGDLELQQSGTSRVFLAGHPKGEVKTDGTGVTRVDAAAGTDLSSRGRLAVDPVLTPGVQAGLTNIAGAGRTAVHPDAATVKAPAPTSMETRAKAQAQAQSGAPPQPQTGADAPLTLTATATATGKKTTQSVAAPEAATGATLSPALTGTGRPAVQSSTRTASPLKQAAPGARPAVAAAVSDDHNPVDTDRWCSVPRNDIAQQALQPTPNQVEWAVDMAVRGDLTSGWVTQGGWRSQTGLGTVDPQSLFPSPTLAGGGRIPAQVELGILAQESNLWQAESGAIPGQMGNPLASVAGFYGHTGTAPSDYWKIDWTNSDCGYGVGQVTDGMRLAGHEKPGETSLPATTQKAVALDYTVNVAASLQILADKWNEVHTAGQTVTVNDDDPSKPENWFTAVWNYNLGFNPPGSGPGGPDGPWGLGWYNNPANPIYPPSRLAFMDTSLDPGANHDAAHPQDWPYEEKVMGWAAWSIDTGHSYATSGRQDWPGESGFSSAGFQPSWWLTAQERSEIKPPLDTFCNTSDDCDVSDPPPCETDHIEGCDQLHWWHEPNTVWKTDCADTCGHESIKYATLRAEPGRGTRLQYGTPDCAAPPLGSLVVHSVPDGTSTWGDCGTAHSQGTFQFTFYPDTAGEYEAKGDLHQIGGGYQGHFWYAHTRDADYLGGDGGRMTVLGDWKLGTSLTTEQAMVYVHIPDTGAQATDAVYQVVTPSGTVRKQVSQDANASNKWVPLGAFHFGDQAPEVRLSNADNSGTGDTDIAWDAVAFIPGVYDTVPDVTVPDPDLNAPEPDYESQVPRADAPGIPSVAAMSTTRRQTCSTTDDQGRRECVTVVTNPQLPSSGSAAAKDRPTPRLSPSGLVPWCSMANPGRTRLELCQPTEVTMTWSVDDAVVGAAVFDALQEVKTYSQSGTYTEALSVSAKSVPAALGAVTLTTWNSACTPNCSTSFESGWDGVETWAPLDDHHWVTGVRSHTWTNSTAGATDKMTVTGSVDFTAASLAGATGPAVALAQDTQEVRCDSKYPANTTGCVFWKFAPTMTMNFKKYPAAALYYWILQQKLSSHPGQFPDSPLHKEGNSTVNDRNRSVVCELGGAGVRLKPEFHPNATPDNVGVQCDEYPFATSKESGGQFLDNGTTYGSECATLYATDGTNGWHIYSDERFGIPLWTEICGRASMAGGQNQNAGSTVAGYTTSLRIQDGDPFFVDVPELAGCDPDSHCTIS